MTGELTLLRQKLPVGGIKEKILAKKRSGINDIILLQQNQKIFLEINKHYIKNMNFHYVNDLNEVINAALLK